MNTQRKLIPMLIVSLALSAGLSACSVDVIDPEQTTPSSPTSSPEGTDESTDESTNGGQFTEGDCDQRNIAIEEDLSTAILSGLCGVVNITATGATVTIEGADSVIITGTENTVIITGAVGAVTVQGDSNYYTGGDTGTVKVEGSTNSVVLNTADDVRILGNDNYVQWSAGVASAEDSGTGNTVIAASGQ